MSLKDKKIHIRNKKDNDIKNYCFEGIDVKEAVLDLIELEIWNKSPIYDQVDEINLSGKMYEKYGIELFQDDGVQIVKKIFGDFEKWILLKTRRLRT